MPAPRVLPLRAARPRAAAACAKRWGPQQGTGPRPCATIPTGSLSGGCARRSPRPMASIPLARVWPLAIWRPPSCSPGQPEDRSGRTGTSWLPSARLCRLPPRPGLAGAGRRSPCPCRLGPDSRPRGRGRGRWTVSMRSGITNPHNPTASSERSSLEPLLERFALVSSMQAFLPLVPAREADFT